MILQSEGGNLHLEIIEKQNLIKEIEEVISAINQRQVNFDRTKYKPSQKYTITGRILARISVLGYPWQSPLRKQGQFSGVATFNQKLLNLLA